MKWSYPFLFVILTFWLSEASFRPPDTYLRSNYKDDYWHGWKGVIKGYSIGIERAGPVYHIAKIPYELFGVHEISPKRRVAKNSSRIIPADRKRPVDIIALLIWIFICYGGAIIVDVNRRLNKRVIEANGMPLHSRSYRKPMIVVVALMSLGITVAEVRNTMRSNLLETQQTLADAVKGGDIVAVKEYLGEGDDVNVIIGFGSTLLDRAIWNRNDLDRFGGSKKDKKNAKEIIELIKTNGGKRYDEVHATVEPKLEFRESDSLIDLAYLEGADTPYTGTQIIKRKNGRKNETNFKNGKRDGLSVYWNENGQKLWENNFKNGKRDGLSVSWHENGQKKREANYKDGKMVSKKLWNRKGELFDSFEEAEKE